MLLLVDNLHVSQRLVCRQVAFLSSIRVLLYAVTRGLPSLRGVSSFLPSLMADDLSRRFPEFLDTSPFESGLLFRVARIFLLSANARRATLVDRECLAVPHPQNRPKLISQLLVRPNRPGL